MEPYFETNVIKSFAQLLPCFLALAGCAAQTKSFRPGGDRVPGVSVTQGLDIGRSAVLGRLVENQLVRSG
jgi:hypothetical protein